MNTIVQREERESTCVIPIPLFFLPDNEGYGGI
jgi:hypothetical protein